MTVTVRACVWTVRVDPRLWVRMRVRRGQSAGGGAMCMWGWAVWTWRRLLAPTVMVVGVGCVHVGVVCVHVGG